MDCTMSQFKRIRRIILIDCHQCYGRAVVATKDGYVPCTAPGCFHGKVERVIVEFVPIEDKVGA